MSNVGLQIGCATFGHCAQRLFQNRGESTGFVARGWVVVHLALVDLGVMLPPANTLQVQLANAHHSYVPGMVVQNEWFLNNLYGTSGIDIYSSSFKRIPVGVIIVVNVSILLLYLYFALFFLFYMVNSNLLNI